MHAATRAIRPSRIERRTVARSGAPRALKHATTPRVREPSIVAMEREQHVSTHIGDQHITTQ
eukprot:13862697-Alexandrium_andersonii.AAC.1